MSDGDDDTYYRRVAIHGDISRDDVPEDIDLVDEELDEIIEILHFRDYEEYRVANRYIGEGVLHMVYGRVDGFEDALTLALHAADDSDNPILRRIYTYAPTTGESEPGEDRIPAPWDERDGK